MNTEWHKDPNGQQWLEIDLQGEKALGRLRLQWGEDYATAYDIETSVNGLNWETVHSARRQTGRAYEVVLAPTEARFLRVVCREGRNAETYVLRNVELEAPQQEMTPERYYRAAARDCPGCYPRWLSNEQAYWTLTATPEDEREVALCEDGTLEPHKRGFTIMPLLRVGGQLVTRNEAAVEQFLEKDYLPIPSVRWTWKDVVLDIKVIAHGGSRSSAYARYVITNRSDRPVEGHLYLVFHPMQVYPPWQLGHDGFAPIRSIAYMDGVVRINNDRPVYLLTPADRFAARGGAPLARQPVEGDIAHDIAHDRLPDQCHAVDEAFASGAAVYDFKLPPGASRRIFVAVPLHDDPPALRPGTSAPALERQCDAMLAETTAYWDAAVSRVRISIPDRDVENTLKANVAYVLVTKDGPAFQPGSRGYDKAWMRDGGDAALALLHLGFVEEVKAFIEWIAGYQLDDGEIPPIIDNKHQDPLWEEKQGLHEFDSQGQFVHAVLEYYLFTHDREFLVARFPQVLKALTFLQKLREQRTTPEYRDDPDKKPFFNILPASRSHEGYGLAHSYWDDLWALKGWKDGISIAGILGDHRSAEWMERDYRALSEGFYASIATVMARDGIDYIPGCAEQGDFDPTATAVAITACDEKDNLPAEALRRTFDRYYERLEERLRPGAHYVFTPYEVRNIAAFTRLGQRERALRLLYFALRCRRPAAWCHLAEVVHSRERFPCYIGDMPHTWVGAELVTALRTLLVYEEADRIVLGAGIDPAWLAEGRPVVAENLPTRFGTVSFVMQQEGDAVRVQLEGDARPGGFILRWPLEAALGSVTVNGRPWSRFSADSIVLDELPAEVVGRYGSEEMRTGRSA